MKIGVMGLGNIAIKAFLPIVSHLNDEHEWFYFSRDATKLNKLKAAYNLKNTYSDFDEFQGIDFDAIMIHTPTSTHEHYIKMFLDKGVHVYVDKPISEDYETTTFLIEYAQSKNLILYTGFNRRFAPFVTKLKPLHKNRIQVQKHRINAQQETVYSLYDHMIHPVDTALFLIDEPILSTHIHVQQENGNLMQAEITFYTDSTIATVTANMQSGTNLERIEVMGSDGYHCVDNLDTYRIESMNRTELHRFSDWDSTLIKRGFEPMVMDFLRVIQSDIDSNTVSLASHYYIDQIIKTLK